MTNSINDLDVEIVLGDVTDPSSLSNAFKGTNQVFHLAGLVSIMPRMGTKMFDVNVRGTLNVIDACEKNSVERLIYTSSIHAIPPSPESVITNETNVIDPDLVEGDYGKSKALATIEVIKSSQNGSLECVIVCPTGIIGPYDYHSSYIGRTISLYCSRKIPAYVSGGYDFVDVRDVATGTISASQNGNPGQHYILSGQAVTVEEFFNELQLNTRILSPKIKIPIKLANLASYASGFGASFIGKDAVLTPYSIKTLGSNSMISSQLARKELGFKPRNWTESLTDQICWMRENGIIN
tara:strand:+ start:30325 stop:31209 length:885 start_codon:yes stop_codon:yes gene_type:complete